MAQEEHNLLWRIFFVLRIDSFESESFEGRMAQMCSIALLMDSVHSVFLQKSVNRKHVDNNSASKNIYLLDYFIKRQELLV